MMGVEREILSNCQAAFFFVQSSLSNAGFVANSFKSLWDPTQSLVWLGLNWNLVSGSISIRDRRISNFIALVDKFLQSAPYVTRACVEFVISVLDTFFVLCL